MVKSVVFKLKQVFFKYSYNLLLRFILLCQYYTNKLSSNKSHWPLISNKFNKKIIYNYTYFLLISRQTQILSNFSGKNMNTIYSTAIELIM